MLCMLYYYRLRNTPLHTHRKSLSYSVCVSEHYWFPLHPDVWFSDSGEKIRQSDTYFYKYTLLQNVYAQCEKGGERRRQKYALVCCLENLIWFFPVTVNEGTFVYVRHKKNLIFSFSIFSTLHQGFLYIYNILINVMLSGWFYFCLRIFVYMPFTYMYIRAM